MARFDRDDFIQQCIDACEGSDTPCEAVQAVIERTMSSPDRVADAMGEPEGGPVFTTWYRSDFLTVLHVVWPPEVDLFAHDHQMWAVIGLYGGREDNRFYRRLSDGSIAPKGSQTLLKGDVMALDEKAVHAVANRSREWTGSIHVYGGDYFAPARTMWRGDPPKAEPFDADVLQQVLERAASRARTPC